MIGYTLHDIYTEIIEDGIKRGVPNRGWITANITAAVSVALHAHGTGRVETVTPLTPGMDSDATVVIRALGDTTPPSAIRRGSRLEQLIYGLENSDH